MKFSNKVVLGVLSASTIGANASGIQLDVNDRASIKSAASQVASGLVNNWFKGESEAITAGWQLPAPWFWWQSGEIFAGLIDYWSYTRDATYNDLTRQYLQAQLGPSNDFMLESHRADEANDDQSHFGFAAMTAAEKHFPFPVSATLTWMQIVESLWNSQVERWDDVCGGGLRWGIEPGESGSKWTYKNTITNGAFFQLSARLALESGDRKFSDWAQKSWDWVKVTGLISRDYQVYDGIHTDGPRDTCHDFQKSRWSINHAIYLYGAAVMFKITGSAEWHTHVDGLLNSAISYYFTPPGNSSSIIMWEPDCELRSNGCDNDMKIFKATMARYLYKTAVVAPHTAGTIFELLGDSARGAAAACQSEGQQMCGSKWYVSGDDGDYGPQAQLAALEVIQGLLSLQPKEGQGNHIRDAGVEETEASATSTEETKDILSTSLEPVLVATTDATPTATEETTDAPFAETTTISNDDDDDEFIASSEAAAATSTPPPSTETALSAPGNSSLSSADLNTVLNTTFQASSSSPYPTNITTTKPQATQDPTPTETKQTPKVTSVLPPSFVYTSDTTGIVPPVALVVVFSVLFWLFL